MIFNEHYLIAHPILTYEFRLNVSFVESVCAPFLFKQSYPFYCLFGNFVTTAETDPPSGVRITDS